MAIENSAGAVLHQKNITVVGAGIVGLWQAWRLAQAGHRVRLVEASATPFADSASRWAGAMIAPECEAEAAPRAVRDMGRRGLALWRAAYPGLIVNGTLVVAAARDAGELTRFARMTERHSTAEGAGISALEPALAGRFGSGLLFADEAHMDAGVALTWLLQAVRDAGVAVSFGVPWRGDDADITVDCRGMAARAELIGLRGVRGERALVRCNDIALSRPVRLLHPRQPIYVVPQSDGRFVIGATVIEREDDGPMTLRSAMELLGSAFALHPSFAEAEVLELGVGVRPAFADNVPRVSFEDGGRVIRVNGVYRHGFLLAPVLADDVVALIS